MKHSNKIITPTPVPTGVYDTPEEGFSTAVRTTRVFVGETAKESSMPDLKMASSSRDETTTVNRV